MDQKIVPPPDYSPQAQSYGAAAYSVPLSAQNTGSRGAPPQSQPQTPGTPATYPSGMAMGGLPPGTQVHYTGAAGQQPGAHPGMVMLPSGTGGFMVPVQQFPTATFCPATGGAHVPVSRAGLMGIIIGIVFCPIGLIAIPFDKKVQCQQCKYVVKESWGGC